MKANTRSLHARLYKFTYKSELPTNLCPYFWKLVAAILMFIPNFILQLPILFCNLFTNKTKDNPKEQRENGFFIYMGLVFLFIYCIGTYNMIKAMFNCYSYNEDLADSGVIINGLILTVLTTILCCILKNKHDERIYDDIGEKEPNIIKEFIKAKYHKYCPKIDWK